MSFTPPHLSPFHFTLPAAFVRTPSRVLHPASPLSFPLYPISRLRLHLLSCLSPSLTSLLSTLPYQPPSPAPPLMSFTQPLLSPSTLPYHPPSPAPRLVSSTSPHLFPFHSTISATFARTSSHVLPSFFLHRPSPCRLWPSMFPSSLWCPRHCYVAVILPIFPQHMAKHLPSLFLDLSAQWLRVCSLEYLLIVDVILPINLQDSPQTFMLETIHCLVIFQVSHPYNKTDSTNALYNVTFVLLVIFFELHILPSLVHAPLSFDRLLLRSFIPTPSLQSAAPKYVNYLTTSITCPWILNFSCCLAFILDILVLYQLILSPARLASSSNYAVFSWICCLVEESKAM